MPQGRDLTIDTARGIAIVAIVLGHVLRGLVAAELMGGAGDFKVWDKALYLSHLAVFAFLAGLFVHDGVERDGVRPYVRRRVSTFAYLFLLWSLIQGGAKLLTAALVNTPTSVAEVLRVWEPEGQLWFLPFLAVATCAAALTRPWRRRWLAALTISLLLLLAVARWGIEADAIGLQGLPLLLFYFSGVLVGSSRFIHAVRQLTVLAAALWAAALGASYAVLVLFTGSAPPTVDAGNRTGPSVAWGLLGSVCGVGAVLALSRLLSVLGGAAGLLVLIGRRSLEIFLAHILAAAGVRIVLAQLGVSNASVHLILGTIGGVALPVALWWVGRRVHFPYLFEAPRLLTGAVASVQESAPVR